MAGLFKNIERVLAASNFATNTHKFLVRFPLARYNPAAYYFDPKTRVEGLPKSHDLDVHKLGVVALALARQTQNLTGTLANAEAGKFDALASELREEVRLNETALSSFIKNLRIATASGLYDVPLESAVGYLYATAFYAKGEDSFGVAFAQVEAAVRDKIQYASSQNLIDLVAALARVAEGASGVNEGAVKALWRIAQPAIEAKTWDWEFQQVQFHGWDLDQYEQANAPAQKGDSASRTFFRNEYDQYLADLQRGNSTLANWKRDARAWTNEFKNRILYRVLHREARIQYEFDAIDVKQEKEKFFVSLKALQKSLPEAEKTLQVV